MDVINKILDMIHVRSTVYFSKSVKAPWGMEVVEQSIPREMLYFADELFFTGTAAEITPIRSVDRIDIGPGHRGPVTKQLQEVFFGLFSGATPDSHSWLEPVSQAMPTPVAI